jgi:hypothetical protein
MALMILIMFFWVKASCELAGRSQCSSETLVSTNQSTQHLNPKEHKQMPCVCKLTFKPQSKPWYMATMSTSLQTRSTTTGINKWQASMMCDQNLHLFYALRGRLSIQLVLHLCITSPLKIYNKISNNQIQISQKYFSLSWIKVITLTNTYILISGNWCYKVANAKYTTKPRQLITFSWPHTYRASKSYA